MMPPISSPHLHVLDVTTGPNGPFTAVHDPPEQSGVVVLRLGHPPSGGGGVGGGGVGGQVGPQHGVVVVVVGPGVVVDGHGPGVGGSRTSVPTHGTVMVEQSAAGSGQKRGGGPHLHPAEQVDDTRFQTPVDLL